MKECFQFRSMNMLDHGLDIRAWYEGLKRGTAQSPKWRLPEWIDHPAIKEHFATVNDAVIRDYQIYHDCGKPFCREMDAEGRQHFPDHAAVSKKRWLECGGSEEVAELIGMDMDVHLLKACDVDEFAKRPQAITLLLTGLCELHSNAAGFGGIDSTGFKIKFKALERFGKRIVAAKEKLGPETADLALSGKLWHYIVVRKDIPAGNQLAQAVHAAAESAVPLPTPGDSAIVLHARDQEHLVALTKELDKAGLKYHCVYESEDDRKFPGQFMSIGLHPTPDKEAVRKVLSNLPLAK